MIKQMKIEWNMSEKYHRKGVMICGWCKWKAPALRAFVSPHNPPCTPISLFVKPTSPLNIPTPIIPLTFTHLSSFSLQTNFNCAILCCSLPCDPPPLIFPTHFTAPTPLSPPLFYINPPLQTFWLPSWDPPPTFLPVIPLKLHVSISLCSHILRQTAVVWVLLEARRV